MTKLLEPPGGRQVFRRTFEPAPADIDEAGVRAALEEKSVEAKRQLMSES